MANSTLGPRRLVIATHEIALCCQLRTSPVRHAHLTGWRRDAHLISACAQADQTTGFSLETRGQRKGPIASPGPSPQQALEPEVWLLPATGQGTASS